jgi:glucose uptake protein GlcU
MSLSDTSSFLRRILLADAAATAATGLLMMAGAGRVAQPLGLPPALLQYAGMILLPVAALIAYLATREHLSRTGVWAVIVCNAMWAADSILLLLSAWVEPTRLGHAFVIAQALAVAVFAELEYFGLRRVRTVAA